MATSLNTIWNASAGIECRLPGTDEIVATLVPMPRGLWVVQPSAAAADATREAVAVGGRLCGTREAAEFFALMLASELLAARQEG